MPQTVEELHASAVVGAAVDAAAVVAGSAVVGAAVDAAAVNVGVGGGGVTVQ